MKNGRINSTHFAVIVLTTLSAFLFSSVSAGVGEVRIISGGDSATSKSIVLPLDKAVIIELPEAATDVLISNPEKVEAVIRSPKRVYLLGMEAGQANAFFFDERNRQILNLEIVVERDVKTLTALFKKLMPDSRIEVEAVNENIILKGSVANEADAMKAQNIAMRFADEPEQVMSMLTTREQNQVMLKVRIVEMQRSLVRQLGINGNAFAQFDDIVLDTAWNTRFPFSGNATGGVGGSIGTPGFGDIRQLDFAFEAFEASGLVKTLAEPTLTSVSGEGAQFLAGGEFPVPVTSDAFQTTIEFKKFGVSLGFRPIVMSRGKINMKIQTEVSEVDSSKGFSLGTTGGVDPETGEDIANAFLIPGLTVRRVENVVELPSGGSMAIAGLLQENIQSAVDGVPALKDVPVLGQLFRSNEFLRDETELVIIVTPYLVEPTHHSNLTDPAEGFVHTTAVQQLLTGQMESVYGLKSQDAAVTTLQGPLGFILD